MVREVILRDDLDGSYDDVQPCVLTWQDVSVDVDLSAANRDRIDQALAAALAAGRRRRRAAGDRARLVRPTRAESEHRAAVRAWARTAGLDVPARGPIPDPIEHAWADAHRDPTPTT